MRKIILLILLITPHILEGQTIYPSGVSDCIARWNFSSSGTITSLPDVSGNGNNGTANNLTATNMHLEVYPIKR